MPPRAIRSILEESDGSYLEDTPMKAEVVQEYKEEDAPKYVKFFIPFGSKRFRVNKDVIGQ